MQVFLLGGYRVSVVDIWAEHISAIAKVGLRLGAGGDRVIRIFRRLGL